MVRLGAYFTAVCAIALGVTIPAVADNLRGHIGNSSQWGSSWLDFTGFRNFSKGDTLRIKLKDTSAKCVLVRLLGRDDSPDEQTGVVGDARTVEQNKTVTVTLDMDYSNIRQISVHGGEPWGQTLCADNGPAHIQSVEYTPVSR